MMHKFVNKNKFIMISFVQRIATLSPVCFSSISALHSILSTTLSYCLYLVSDSLSLIQLLTGFSPTLPTVHNLSSLLAIGLFRLRLTVVCHRARLKDRSSSSAMQKTSALSSTTWTFSIIHLLTTCKFTSAVLAARRTPCAGSLLIASVMRLPGAPHADYS